jgi:hypothetical protein
MRAKLFFGLGGSCDITNSFLPFFIDTRLIFFMVVDALSYVMECEQDMQDCYNSMSPQEQAWMNDNSMLNLHTDELGRSYYV